MEKNIWKCEGKQLFLQDVTPDDSDYDAIDYDYYYDQLVPEHERFFQVIIYSKKDSKEHCEGEK